MTVIIAVKCIDGSVICSDTRMCNLPNGTYFDGYKKIFELPGNYYVGISQAVEQGKYVLSNVGLFEKIAVGTVAIAEKINTYLNTPGQHYDEKHGINCAFLSPIDFLIVKHGQPIVRVMTVYSPKGHTWKVFVSDKNMEMIGHSGVIEQAQKGLFKHPGSGIVEKFECSRSEMVNKIRENIASIAEGFFVISNDTAHAQDPE